MEHFLSTGDTVTVVGVCANANGIKTVTVVDRYNVTLNGTSGPCSYGAGGTITATSDTTNFAELNITPPSVVVGNVAVPCDLNADGRRECSGRSGFSECGAGYNSMFPAHGYQRGWSLQRRRCAAGDHRQFGRRVQTRSVIIDTFSSQRASQPGCDDPELSSAAILPAWRRPSNCSANQSLGETAAAESR